MEGDSVASAVFIALSGVAYLIVLLYLYSEKKNRRVVNRLRMNSEASFSDRREIFDISEMDKDIENRNNAQELEDSPKDFDRIEDLKTERS